MMLAFPQHCQATFHSPGACSSGIPLAEMPRVKRAVHSKMRRVTSDPSESEELAARSIRPAAVAEVKENSGVRLLQVQEIGLLTHCRDRPNVTRSLLGSLAEAVTARLLIQPASTKATPAVPNSKFGM